MRTTAGPSIATGLIALLLMAGCGAGTTDGGDTLSADTTAVTTDQTTTSSAPSVMSFEVIDTNRLPAPVLVGTSDGDLVMLQPEKPAIDVVEGASGASPPPASLSADGSTVYVGMPSPSRCGRQIARVSLHDRKIVDLGIDGDDPLPSPDGRRLAFTRGIPETPNCAAELVVRDLATAEERAWRAAGDDVWSIRPVAWAPDGTKLLYSISWESPQHAGIVDVSSEGERLVPAPVLQPSSDEPYQWRPAGFLADGTIALVGHCCWYYVDDHRDPAHRQRAPYLLTAEPGKRPVESKDLPSVTTEVHPDGGHYLWIDEGTLWIAAGDAAPVEVASGVEWAKWG